MKIVYRRCVTLIEMMIVMFLIAMIIGVVAYNYRGTLEEGKAFKTQVAKEKLYAELSLILSLGPNNEEDIQGQWAEWIKRSPRVQNPNDLIFDGWGEPFKVEMRDGELFINSERYNKYVHKNPATLFRGDSSQE